MASVLGLDHVSIIVKDADASLAFYQSLLGLGTLERPNLAFPGYWVDLLAGQSLHIMQLPNPNEETIRPEQGGRDYHFALRVDCIDTYAEKLDKMGKILHEVSLDEKRCLCVIWMRMASNCLNTLVNGRFKWCFLKMKLT